MVLSKTDGDWGKGERRRGNAEPRERCAIEAETLFLTLPPVRERRAANQSTRCMMQSKSRGCGSGGHTEQDVKNWFESNP